MTRGRRAALVGAVLLGTLAADQATKRLAERGLTGVPEIVRLGGFLRLELAQNRGAFLSLGENLPAAARYLLFEVLVGAALAVTLAFTLRLRGAHPAQLTALALLTGGGLGNLVDRLARDGAVLDFVTLAAGPLHTGIFNLADAAITTGALLLLIPWRPTPPAIAPPPPPAPPPPAAPSPPTPPASA